MPAHQPQHLELLAPAGSIEAFFAAMEHGADAVYCGLEAFSARAKARNFTIDEMERLAAYAHREGRRIYVTLNTLIKEAELPQMVDILAGLAACRIDGIIIQDFGVWRLARNHFPELPLHASTQMVIHNAAGVLMLEEMGFSRAVLARELSIAEIAAIRRETTIELEHFIHGALCYSMSGLCQFSSFLDGRSGNRGRCAQPCRRRYSSRKQPGFYFSTSDLSAIDLIPELAEAGVISFKIEGRMKSAEYVAAVVSAYRKVIDAPPRERKQATTEARERLSQSFGRPETSGFLRGSAPAGMAQPQRKGGIGQELGQVEQVQGSSITFTTGERLHVGDKLRIQPQTDLAGTSFTVKELFLERKPIKRAEPGTTVRIPTPFTGIFQNNDLIYKVSGGRLFTLSEEACRRRLSVAQPLADEVQLTIGCDTCLEISGTAVGITFSQDYPVEMLAAEHSPLSSETLRQIFAKSGHPGLQLGRLTVGQLPSVVIKPSQLNAIRRDFYQQLAELVTQERQRQRQLQINQALASLLKAQPPHRTAAIPASLSVVIGQGQDLGLIDDPDIKQLILPLTPEILQATAKQERRLAPQRERLVWDVPTLIFPGEWRQFQKIIQQLQRQGYSRFRINNLGHFNLFSQSKNDQQPGPTLLAGPWLYTLNSQAVLALKELGASEFSFALEDDHTNLINLLSRDTGLNGALTSYASIPLLTSRIPMRGQRSNNILESEGSGSIRLDFSSGLTVARAEDDYSLFGRCHALNDLGLGNQIIDLSHIGATSRRGKEILAAAESDQPLEHTSLFNFERGLQ